MKSKVHRENAFAIRMNWKIKQNVEIKQETDKLFDVKPFTLTQCTKG